MTLLSVLAVGLLAGNGLASPIQASNQGPNEPAPRDGTTNGTAGSSASSNDSQSMNPKVWIPLVIAAIVLFCVVLMSWTRGSVRRSLSFFGFSTVVTPGAPLNSGPRELTAEQLAGTINGDTGPAGAQPRARRQRRPRRTPSQRSTRSLPAYNKEPGAEEVVIFRGRDAEDATTMPAARVDDSLNDDQHNNTSLHLRQESHGSSDYAPIPNPTTTHILLNSPYNDSTNDTSLDLPSQLRQPPGEGMPRRTYDDEPTNGAETRGLLSASNTPDIRGEAPPYSESVFMPHLGVPAANTVSPAAGDISRLDSRPLSPSQAQPPSANLPPASRPSGFRTLLNRMSQSISGGPTPSLNPDMSSGNNHQTGAPTQNHNRGQSDGSTASSSPLPPSTSNSYPPPAASASSASATTSPSTSRPLSLSRTRTRSNNTTASTYINHQHRASPSASSSTTVNLFRPLSRGRSRSSNTLSSSHPYTHHTNAPSSTSLLLHSISPPLTHTAMKTEFTYPKTGPTPEQLKVIAHRASVVRFGVPFGDDAVRYAATHGRTATGGAGDEPPPFEDAVASTSGSGSGASPAIDDATTVSATAAEEDTDARRVAASSNADPSGSIVVVPPSTPPPAAPERDPVSATAMETVSSVASTSSSMFKSLSSSSVTPSTSARTPVSEFGVVLPPPTTNSESISRSSVYSAQTYRTAIESLDPNSNAKNATSGTSRGLGLDTEALSSFDVDLEPGSARRFSVRSTRSTRSLTGHASGRDVHVEASSVNVAVVPS